MDALLTDSFERLLQGACSPAVVREVERSLDAGALWADIDASGFAELLVPGEGGASSQRQCRGIEPNGPDANGTAIRGQLAPSCSVRDDLRLRVVQLREGVTLASGESLAGDAVKWENGAVVKSGKQPSDFVGATLHGLAEPSQRVLIRI
ncbi:MAG TPA: hypothetical protein PLO41_12860, partial [Rubrivivax sp.]|nr:hypothetical protein [Rubrivivax sp.]